MKKARTGSQIYCVCGNAYADVSSLKRHHLKFYSCSVGYSASLQSIAQDSTISTAQDSAAIQSNLSDANSSDGDTLIQLFPPHFDVMEVECNPISSNQQFGYGQTSADLSDRIIRSTSSTRSDDNHLPSHTNEDENSNFGSNADKDHLPTYWDDQNNCYDIRKEEEESVLSDPISLVSDSTKNPSEVSSVFSAQEYRGMVESLDNYEAGRDYYIEGHDELQDTELHDNILDQEINFFDDEKRQAEFDTNHRIHSRRLLIPATDLSPWEEKLLILITDNSISLTVYDAIMQWASAAAKDKYEFNGPSVTTVLKKMTDRYKSFVGDRQTKTVLTMGDTSEAVNIYKFDAKQQIQRLLLDETLMSDALWKGAYSVDSTNEEEIVYGELNTGSWWNETERRMSAKLQVENHYLCPLIFFIDGTHADEKGRLEVEPVLLTLGNMRSSKRRTDKAQILLGFVPTYPRCSEERARDRRFRNTKPKYLTYYHRCLEIILSDVKKLCEEDNGVLMDVVGLGKVHLHFEVAMFLGDTKGQDMLCCMYASKSADLNRVCRQCDKATRDLDKISIPTRSFSQDEIHDIVSNAITVLRERRPGTVKSARDKLKEISQYEVHTSLNFSFGGDPQGIYGCTPFETLHVYYLGLLKYLLISVYGYSEVNESTRDWLIDRYRNDSVPSPKDYLKSRPSSKKETTKVRTDVLERRIRLVRICCNRQSDRNVPRTPFNSGVTSLAKLTGQEYPGLCLVTMITMEGLVSKNSEVERVISLLLWLSISLDCLLTSEVYNAKQLLDLDKKIKIYMFLYRSFVGPQREAVSECGLRIIKFHALSKYVMQIKKFGSSNNFFGGFLESSLKAIVKRPTKRTNKQQNRFANDLMTRYYESLILAQSKQTMREQHLLEKVANNQQENFAPINTDSATVKYVIGKSCYYCKYNKKEEKWETWINGTNQCRLFHPLKDDSKGNSWVQFICDEATELKYLQVRLSFQLDVSVSGSPLHDTFRCHPNFHSRPWFDFAMKTYVNEENTEYQNAIKILLWGELSMKDQDCDDERASETIIGVAYNFRSHNPVPRHHMLTWLHADHMTATMERVDPDCINTAFVLPAMPLPDPNSTDRGIPDDNDGCTLFGENHDYYVIVPPRSKWGEIGWDIAEELVNQHMLLD
jgi:hypothetical protein